MKSWRAPRASSLMPSWAHSAIRGGRGFFRAQHREARSELALTGIAGGRLTNAVIDRSFIDSEGSRWVIDFKTSRHEGGETAAFLEREVERYRAQLETYVALARALGPAAGARRSVLSAARRVSRAVGLKGAGREKGVAHGHRACRGSAIPAAAPAVHPVRPPPYPPARIPALA